MFCNFIIEDVDPKVQCRFCISVCAAHILRRRGNIALYRKNVILKQKRGMSDMPDMNQIRQLVAIADAGTISKAAEQLHLSQPALTRSIQRLEREWNVSLFDRTKNRVVLNATGEVAVLHARRILTDVDGMTRAVREYERSLHTIAIGSCAPGPVPELYQLLSGSFSGMTILSERCTGDELVSRLLDGTYQIIITDKPIEQTGVLCSPFCDERLYLMVQASHPLAEKTEGVYFADLAGETMLLYNDIGVWQKIVDEKLKQTTFILQDRDEAFNALLAASALPAFSTDLTLRNRNRYKENRIAIPFLDPEAVATFYCSVLRKNKKYLP